MERVVRSGGVNESRTRNRSQRLPKQQIDLDIMTEKVESREYRCPLNHEQNQSDVYPVGAH